tara:strand:- start:686 stop:1420 length:735 start_codon:yes stop_codon:yes gene_type:complete
MNFLNPYLELYCKSPELEEIGIESFYREILWLFLKNLDNRLKMFQHRVNININNASNTTYNQQFGSIYSHNTSINLDSFKTKEEIKQREELLNLVFKSFNSLAEEFNWDKDVIYDAYKKSIRDKYQFAYFTEYKSSRDKIHQGRIRINLENRTCIFTSEVINTSTGILKTKTLLETEQGNFAWWRMIKEFGWLNSNMFGLKLMKGAIWLTTDKSSEKFEQIINQEIINQDKIDEFLKELYEPIP